MTHVTPVNPLGQRRLTRRTLVLGGAQIGFVGMLGLRMRSMQVEHAAQFRLLAEENRVNVRLIAPERGLIFDRGGVALAENEQNYRITVVREDARDIDAVLDRLASLLGLSAEEKARAREEVEQVKPFLPVTVADRVSWEDISKVAVNAPALPGVTPEVGLSRHYPLGRDFAHVVGYVGPVSDYDLSKIENPDQLLRIPRFQIGKSGVETKLEDKLRGAAGTKRVEVNAGGRVMRELDRETGDPGANLQLTLDAGLQDFVQARLEGQSAAAVVMEVHTGDLRAIASAPSFDPNKFVRGISVPDYRALTENKYRPLANKSVQGTYPPGSTYKMVTALAALDAGQLDPDETFWCPGYTTVGGRRFHCWRHGGHGHVNLFESLQQSCDVFYYELSQRVGIERISAMARRLGFGTAHELPMSAVAEGLTPTKAWKRAYRGSEWQIGDTLNATIGQGFVLASPLQLAVMTGRIASGRAVRPRLVKSIDGAETKSRSGETLGIAPANLDRIREAMHAVSNSRRGTGYRSRIAAEGMEMAGKSGTSQVYSISNAERARGVASNSDLPWEKRDHALFLSFAPSRAPEIAVSVVVEHGGGGSSAAAPIVRDIVLQTLHGGLPPLEAYPAAQRDRIRKRQDGLDLSDPRPDDSGRSRA